MITSFRVTYQNVSRKIELIKKIRERTGMGLKEAKDVSENVVFPNHDLYQLDHVDLVMLADLFRECGYELSETDIQASRRARAALVETLQSAVVHAAVSGLYAEAQEVLTCLRKVAQGN